MEQAACSGDRFQQVAEEHPERRLKALEDQAAKGKAEMEEVSRVSEELSNFRGRKPLHFYGDDVTTEKLVA